MPDQDKLADHSAQLYQLRPDQPRRLPTPLPELSRYSRDELLRLHYATCAEMRRRLGG